MSLTPGTKLGPYEILSPLGAGGMGEVYRARDTRLGRDVAVKVLPQHLSANAEVRARFEREAKTVSSLNHPNICTLFDVGREGETDYLVMELIEGETLATRLAKGALPIQDVLRIGSQVADALDRAHRAGVVHRDLKPGNIMLTRAGAKLMDFGLARATGMAGPGTGSGVTMAALTQSPTMAQPLTAEGTIVGTFQYMSPEQLEGKDTDARSDLWAFGCVLYEMATGKRAFEGKSQASLIGAIMHAEPAPISQIAPMTPPELDRLVRAMLVKDSADRLQSAHDVKVQLSWLADGATSSQFSSVAAGVPSTAASKRSRWPLIAIGAAGGAGIVALAMMLIPHGGAGDRTTGAPQRYEIGRASLDPASTPVISPDGQFIVISGIDNGTRRLYRRSLSSFDLTPIAGTEEAKAPFFSPDGSWIGFCTPSAIKRVPVGGGVAQTILTEPQVDAADWGRDDMIYFCPREGGEGITALAKIPVTGGSQVVVATLDTTVAEAEAWLPEILPDGKTVLISVAGGTSTFHIDAVSPDGKRVHLIENALVARYVEPGYLLYMDMVSQAILSVRFDAAACKIMGTPVPLTDPVDANYAFDVSTDGKIVYVPVAGAGEGRELVWIARDGSATTMMDTRGSWVQPRVSPDGKQVLMRKTAANCELWMFDVERASLARIAQGATDNHDPVWAPDSRRIAYTEVNAGGGMKVQTVEGSREIRTIPTGSDRGHPASWGGDRLVYTVAGRGTQGDIWTCVMTGEPKPEPFLKTQFDERDPSITPDGRFIAYVTNESGANEVFVRRCPSTGEVWQISVGGGVSPVWSRNGRELFYTQGTRMMSVKVETAPAFRVAKPMQLFDGGFNTDRSNDFDVTPDGRFVAVRVPGGVSGQREMRVLLNWPAEMARVEGTVR